MRDRVLMDSDCHLAALARERLWCVAVYDNVRRVLGFRGIRSVRRPLPVITAGALLAGLTGGFPGRQGHDMTVRQDRLRSHGLKNRLGRSRAHTGLRGRSTGTHPKSPQAPYLSADLARARPAATLDVPPVACMKTGM